MQVRKIMSPNVITIPIQAGLEDAARLMKDYDIRHLPVVDGEVLVGLVTERDVRGAMFPAMLEDISVRDLMVADPTTVTPDTLLEDAARLVYRQKIGCLPVIDREGRLQGIVTVADMLAALIEVMGFLSGSSRLDVELPNRPEALEEAVHIILENGGRIIGVSLTKLDKEQPIHLFRLQKIDLEPIVSDLSRAGYKVVSSLG